MSIRVANRIKQVAVNSAAGGTVLTIPAPGLGRRIRVTSYSLVAAAAATVQLNSAAIPKTGPMTMAVGIPLAIAGSAEAPVVFCNENEALNVVVTGAVQVSGHIAYTTEPASA